MNNELLLSQLEKYKDMFINEKKVLNCSDNTIITYLNVLRAPLITLDTHNY